MPTVPDGRLDVVNVGGGSRETEKVADFVGSVIEVAVNEAMLVVTMVVGAL